MVSKTIDIAELGKPTNGPNQTTETNPHMCKDLINNTGGNTSDRKEWTFDIYFWRN